MRSNGQAFQPARETRALPFSLDYRQLSRNRFGEAPHFATSYGFRGKTRGRVGDRARSLRRHCRLLEALR